MARFHGMTSASEAQARGFVNCNGISDNFLGEVTAVLHSDIIEDRYVVYILVSADQTGVIPMFPNSYVSRFSETY